MNASEHNLWQPIPLIQMQFNNFKTKMELGKLFKWNKIPNIHNQKYHEYKIVCNT